MVGSVLQFRDFLMEAKRNTYASDSPVVLYQQFLENTKVLEYKKGDLTYKDIYLGSERFSGMEIVERKGIPIWSMVYSGGVFSHTDNREVYMFLKEALRNVPTEFPARGPSEFRNGQFAYENEYLGSIEYFGGEESITWNDVEVYRLSYNGGNIR